MDEAHGNSCYGFLDQPRDHQVVCGTLVADGWLVDPTGTDRVIELRVDDVPVPASIVATARPDVSVALRATAKGEHVFWFLRDRGVGSFLRWRTPVDLRRS